MEDSTVECDLDLVIEMEEMSIGVEEILQYARGLLGRDQFRALIHGLEKQLTDSKADGEIAEVEEVEEVEEVDTAAFA